MLRTLYATTTKILRRSSRPFSVNYGKSYQIQKCLSPKKPTVITKSPCDILWISSALKGNAKSRFSSCCYATQKQSSDDLYYQRDKVPRWTSEQLAEWMQSNANLAPDQIQVILSSNMRGEDILDQGISSFKKLRAEYPQATRELWRATQKLRLALMIPTKLRPESAAYALDTNILNMPFVGRTAAIERALIPVQTHADVAIYSKNNANIDQVRLGNSHIFAVGAPGIGKTRFGEEFPRLLAERATGDLKSKLEKVRTVRITFRNGKMIDRSTDFKWESFMDQVNWILTSRAIHAVYDIKESYPEWAEVLLRMLGDDLPQQFNMDSFTEELIKRDSSATTLYIHLDEVQEVTALPPDVGANLIRTLSTIYAKYNQEKLLTLLLFSGTILSDIQNVLQKIHVGSSTDFPLVSLPMETLEEDQVFNIIRKMKAEGKLPWVPVDWETNVPFKKLVAYTGGVPRLIELLFIAGARESDINDAASNLASQVLTRYPMVNMLPVYNACCLALSGKQYQLEDQLPNDPSQTVEKLRSNGYLFLAPEAQLNVPFVYVRLTVLSGAIAKGEFKDKITDFRQKLITPTGSLKWQEFEMFTLIYTIVRVKALLHLTYNTITTQDYFHHAHTMSKNVEGLTFKLVNRDYSELGNRWPASEWPISRTYYHPVYTANVLSTVFLNAGGAPFDGFEFVQLADKEEYIIFAHQNKHTEDGISELNSQTIVAETNKVQKAFKKWKTSDGGKYKEDAELKALKQATKQIVLVIFTNRKIVIDANYPMPHENLVIIDNKDHFGPFKAITKFFTN